MIKDIAYASAFVSFLLEDVERADIKEIILYGSVAREEADKKSDVDLFVDIADKAKENIIEEQVKNSLKRFYKSKLYGQWKLKGVSRAIQVQVGVLDEWKLKRSIISNGIVLFGNYKELPKEGLEHCTLFIFEPITDITKRNRVTRTLFGRREKSYSRKGLLEELNGKQLSQRSFYVPSQVTSKIIELLGKEKISYQLFELWSDVFR